MGEKKFLYYIFFLTIAGIITFGYLVTLPMVNGIEEAKEEISTKDSHLEYLTEKEKKLKTLEEDYGEYKEKISILNGLFPDKKNVSDYLTQIEQASIKENVHITSIKIASTTKKNVQTKKIDPEKTQLVAEGNYYKLPLEMKVTSPLGFSKVMSFIKTLENLSRYTAVDTLEITSNDEGVLEMSTNFNIYVK